MVDTRCIMLLSSTKNDHSQREAVSLRKAHGSEFPDWPGWPSLTSSIRANSASELNRHRQNNSCLPRCPDYRTIDDVCPGFPIYHISAGHPAQATFAIQPETADLAVNPGCSAAPTHQSPFNRFWNNGYEAFRCGPCPPSTPHQMSRCPQD